MHLKKLYTSLFLFIVFIIIFFAKKNFSGELYQDEYHYLPTAILFSHEPIPSLDLLKSYDELNTPLPFILGGWVVNIFGADIANVRLLTFCTSFLLLMIFVWFSPERSKRYFLCLGGLLLFPNYYLCSVFYYTDIFALISVLAGIVAYLKRIHWLSAICFIAAISCRQYMLAFPAAVVAFELLEMLKKSENIRQFSAKIFSDLTWLYYVAAVLSLIPWILLWNGPAPAKTMAYQHYDSHQLISYNFGFVLYSSVCLAVYYVIPEVIITRKIRYFFDYPRNNPALFITLLAIVILLVVFFPAKQAHNPYFTWPYLGYIDQLFTLIGITGFVKQICFGAFMLITLMRFISPVLNLASFIVVINILLLGKAQLSWDKYSLPTIMVLWFLAMFDNQWSLYHYQGQNKREALKMKQ